MKINKIVQDGMKGNRYNLASTQNVYSICNSNIKIIRLRGE